MSLCIQHLPSQVKTARKECERLEEMNRELALQNTDREPQFTQAKEELRRLATEAEELKADYDQGYSELSECSVCVCV